MSVNLSEDVYTCYVARFAEILRTAVASDASGKAIGIDVALRRIGDEMRACHHRGGRVLLVGNGGSAGICSHMAIDISKSGGIRASALNDASALTCIGNDFGYEQVFAKQVEWHASERDVLVAVSSSGQSANILNAVGAGRERCCRIVTLSGFLPDNPLRRLGDINIYLASAQYGFIEIGHLAFLHAVLDILMGWNTNQTQE